MKRKISTLIAIVLLLSMVFGMNTMAAYEKDGSRFLYNETAADEVTVKVTISSDGIPIVAADGTAISELEVTVPYFDLADYGLETFYRYVTNSNGNYATDKGVVERPTLLHLIIYMLEKYQLDAAEEDIGTGLYQHAILGIPKDQYEIYNIAGDVAFASKKALLEPTQTPCSLYMQSLWGHDCNLMYYLNREYPLWMEGNSDSFTDALVGSTCDYILLEDGDSVDIGMFTDYDFYTQSGKGYLNFPEDSYTIEKGSDLTIEKIDRAWGFMDTGFATNHYEENVDLYTYYIGTPDGQFYQAEDENLSDGITFTGFNEIGVYTIYGIKTGNCAPAVSKVNVVEKIEEETPVIPPVQDETSKDDQTDETVKDEPAKDEAAKDETPKDDEIPKEENKNPVEVPKDEIPSDEEQKKEEDQKAAVETLKKEVEETEIVSLKAKKYKSNGIKLTWKNDSNLEGYEVYRSTKKNSNFKSVTSVAAANYTLKKGLNKNKTYYYRVRGYKVVEGEKVYTPYAGITVNLNQTKAIKAITINSVNQAVSGKKVTLTWAKPESMYTLKGYKVYQSTKQKSGFKLAKTAKKETVTIKNLKKGKTYYFKIQGYAKVGKKTVNTKAKTVKVKIK